MQSMLRRIDGVQCTGQDKPYRGRRREVNFDWLRRADKWACFWTIAPSKTKHFNAGLEMLPAAKVQKIETTGSYYGMLVCHELSSKKHTRKGMGTNF